ncbi:MAG: MBL fold metallo-hydrolase [Clostridia bacterium]|nr:MBL fold metallo-hydrolase [Clostridia bacterium]
MSKRNAWILLTAVMLMMRAAAGEELYLRMLDVGSAECMIISVGKETMVVDTAYQRNADEICKALDESGADSIRYLVLTHPHEDHIGGARKLLDRFSVETALLPPIEYGTDTFHQTIRRLRENGAELVYPYPGDVFLLGKAAVTVYGPHPVAYENENNWSIVLMVEYANRRILLTGDAEAEAELDMLAYDDWLPLKADILKVGHHGSDTSSSHRFIEAVSPDCAIISCGGDGSYPHIDTALTLTDCGVSQIVTTEVLGDILIRIDENGEYSVSGKKNAKR